MITDLKIRKLLEQTLELAEEALAKGNYPIGALFTDDEGKVITAAQNECITSHDISAHAEIVGIRQLGESADKDSSERLTLFTSLEPCFGCSFFIARTNVTKIYSAFKDPHKGGLHSLKEKEQFAHFFRKIEINNDVFEDLKEQSRKLMMQYFLNLGREDAAAFYGFSK